MALLDPLNISHKLKILSVKSMVTFKNNTHSRLPPRSEGSHPMETNNAPDDLFDNFLRKFPRSNVGVRVRDDKLA
jgi:hypothetical protein